MAVFEREIQFLFEDTAEIRPTKFFGVPAIWNSFCADYNVFLFLLMLILCCQKAFLPSVETISDFPIDPLLVSFPWVKICFFMANHFIFIG
jgi:hypothetical protein